LSDNFFVPSPKGGVKRAQAGIGTKGLPLGRRKCATVRANFELSAENAKIADRLAGRDEFEPSDDLVNGQ
jgi:hypothetical protein